MWPFILLPNHTTWESLSTPLLDWLPCGSLPRRAIGWTIGIPDSHPEVAYTDALISWCTSPPALLTHQAYVPFKAKLSGKPSSNWWWIIYLQPFFITIFIFWCRKDVMKINFMCLDSFTRLISFFLWISCPLCVHNLFLLWIYLIMALAS